MVLLLDSGHCPYLSHPKLVAMFIKEAASETF